MTNNKYRILVTGEIIQPDDEFLDDDCETWVKCSECRWVVGCEVCGALKPIRRANNG